VLHWEQAYMPPAVAPAGVLGAGEPTGDVGCDTPSSPPRCGGGG